MRPFVLSALAATTLGLGACETTPVTLQRVSFDGVDVWVRWSEEGFNGDRIATFHNGTDWDACVTARGVYPGWRIPARTTIRRKAFVPDISQPRVTFEPQEVTRCRLVE
jgi:hypothetical protein